MNRTLRAALPLALLVAACGKPAAPPPEQPQEAPQRNQADDMSATSEVGGMNQEKVDAVFADTQQNLAKCLMTGSQRVQFLGGDVSFELAIDQSGIAEDVSLVQSTLGDAETEDCMLRVLGAQSWPKPVGGRVGKAAKSLGFDPAEDVRPAVAWEPDQAETGLKSVEEEIAKCKQGGSTNYDVTIYVGTKGQVLSAGANLPARGTADVRRCLLEAVRGATFDSPGSWPAKVTVSL